MHEIIGTKVFSLEDQTRFAKLSGDVNPMHIDPIIARRTLAGSVVVHGVHSLLWCLECIASSKLLTCNALNLRVSFDTFVPVGVPVEAILTSHDDAHLRAEIRVEGVLAVTMMLTFGQAELAEASPRIGKLIDTSEPMDVPFEDVEGYFGRVACTMSPETIARAFPSVARLLGVFRLSGLICLTRLVGMVCPGLHSVFNGLSLRANKQDSIADMCFRVNRADTRYRRVAQDVWGCGWIGTITSSFRPAPTSQPSLQELMQFVKPTEFSGTTSLIIGGSRGLGQLTAKIILAGGGKVIITYAVGKTDADALVTEAISWGRTCEAIAYNVQQDSAVQLSVLSELPRYIYYFATPAIFGQRSLFFSPARFMGFNEFYVSGFYNLVTTCTRLRPEGIDIFYPSSVSLDARPAHMTEYTMSKAAAEILCTDINAQMPKVRVLVRRLPRLPTDQTATIREVETDDPVMTMLPIIRAITVAG